LRPVAERNVAADFLDVDRELADRLAGVEEIRDSGFARDGADLSRRLTRPPFVGRA